MRRCFNSIRGSMGDVSIRGSMGDVADPNIESTRIPGMYISQSLFRFFSYDIFAGIYHT